MRCGTSNWRRRVWRSVAVHLLLKPNLDQGLVGNISCIRSGLDRVEQMLRQTKRDRPGGRLEVGQDDVPGLGPVEVLGGVVLFPEGALFLFGLEFRKRFGMLVHKWFFPCGAWPAPRSLESTFRSCAE